MKAAILAFLVLAAVAFGDGGEAQDNEGYLVCFCSYPAHAFVMLYDGATDNYYVRGLYKEDYGTGYEAPKLPHAGEAPDLSAGEKKPDSATIENDATELANDINYPDDENAGVPKCVCFKVTKGEYDSTVDFINNYPREYDLTSQNCMDFVEDTAENLGKEAGDYDDIPDADSYFGVSDPEEFYENLNEWMQNWGGTLKVAPDRFLAYTNETWMFKNYTNLGSDLEAMEKARQKRKQQPKQPPPAPPPGGDSKPPQYYAPRLHPENFISGGGYNTLYYQALFEDGVVPLKASIIASAEDYEQCGSGCIVVGQNTEIAFSTDFQPAEPSFMWWHFSDGYGAEIANPTHSYSEPGIYRVTMRYLDDSSKTAKFGLYQVKVNASDTQERAAHRVSTASGKEIQLAAVKGKPGVSAVENELNEVPSFGSILGDDQTRVHVKMKDGSTTIANLITKGGAVEEVSVLGSVGVEDERLLEEGPQLFIDCVPVTYTGALYLDEETLEEIAESETPRDEFKKAWGTKIRDKGLNLGNSIKELVMGMLVGMS